MRAARSPRRRAHLVRHSLDSEGARALELMPNAELMTHEPGSALVTTTEELLDVLEVHPLREDRIDPALIDERQVKRVIHSGTTFLALRGPRRPR